MSLTRRSGESRNPEKILVLLTLLDPSLRWDDEVWCTFAILGQPATVGQYIVLAAINRTLKPKSKARIDQWYGQTIL